MRRDRYRLMYLGLADGRTAFKNMFPSPTPPPAPTPPTVTPPPTMPTPDPNSPELMAAAKRATTLAAQGGRSATMLTKAGAGMASTLAGSYAASKLGSG